MEMSWKKVVSAGLMFAVCLCIIVAACYVLLTKESDDSVAPVTGPEDQWPGGFRPEIMVDGKSYYWYGLSTEMVGTEAGGLVEVTSPGASCLPEGYSEYGALTGVTVEVPTEDCVLRAGFYAEGTVYTGGAENEAVYVLMSTDWFKSQYIRFVSPELDSGYRIFWHGRQYEYEAAMGELERLLMLPEGCMEGGTLEFVGRDVLPRKNLGTNCPVNKRTLWYDPADKDYVYVHQINVWSEGQYDMYVKCPVISE